MDERIFIFDNGSVASKLLQHEYKDAEAVKVNGSDLVENFTKFDNNKGRKIYLPFTVEELVANNEQLRRDIQKVESLGFRNLIVLPYEGQSELTIKYKAKEAGILDKEVLKGEQVNEDKNKPYKSVRTGNPVQDLP